MKAWAFTGTRKGLSNDQLLSLDFIVVRLRQQGYTVHHNGLAIGADTVALYVARKERFYTVGHPVRHKDQNRSLRGMCNELRPVWGKPIDRNHNMVNESQLVVACPFEKEEQIRGSGTWATMRYAKRKGRSLCVIWPDGSVEWNSVKKVDSQRS